MAQLLGGGQQGTVTWSVDYDGVSTNNTYSADLTQHLNQGRVVLGGPGSVLGQSTAIPPSAIPAPVPKGQDRGYGLTCQWAA